MSILKLFVISVALIFIFACANPNARIENETEAIAFAYIKITEVAKQVEQQRLSGGIDDAQALAIKAKLVSALQSVKIGESLLCISSTALDCIADKQGASRQANIAIAITKSIREAIQ